MSSAFVDHAIALLCGRSIADAPQILLKQALDADMPPGVKRYILAEVVSFLENDLRHLPQFARLHPDAPGNARLRAAFLRSLAGAYEMSRDQFLELLREAVVFTECYLTRPQWTLESFLFEEEQEITVEAMADRLGYCADYAYFGRILEEILARRGTAHLSRTEFRTLVSRIDARIVEQHSPRELAMLVKPLFDFLLLKEAGLDDPVPLGPILLFLEDKNLTILKEYVESICRLREESALSLRQFAELVEGLASSGRPENAEPSAEEGLPAGEEGSSAKQVPEGPSTGGTKIPEEKPPQEPAAGAGAAHLPDLRTLIGEKQRQRFIRHVFNRDQAYFSGVLATLNRLHTWDEAAAYLKQVYSINRLDPFSGIVVEFTDLVQQRFSGAKGISR